MDCLASIPIHSGELASHFRFKPDAVETRGQWMYVLLTAQSLQPSLLTVSLSGAGISECHAETGREKTVPFVNATFAFNCRVNDIIRQSH
jgi:hypothetical protein